MLLGLILPTGGQHELLGAAMPAGAAQVLPRVGSLVEGPAFYSQLSGPANLARLRRRRPEGRPAHGRGPDQRRPWTGSAC